MANERVEKSGLQVDAALAAFIEGEILAPLGRDAAAFWTGFADLVRQFAPRNLALLEKRDWLQWKIDHWHAERRGKPHDADAYRRFLAVARRPWIAALDQTGPGLCPVLAWEAGTTRRFAGPEELAGVAAEAGLAQTGVADGYLGRGLLLLAHPEVAEAWQTLMSLGGPTKIRKITGREFPVWVDLPAHQPSLLSSPILTNVERLL